MKKELSSTGRDFRFTDNSHWWWWPSCWPEHCPGQKMSQGCPARRHRPSWKIKRSWWSDGSYCHLPNIMCMKLKVDIITGRCCQSSEAWSMKLKLLRFIWNINQSSSKNESMWWMWLTCTFRLELGLFKVLNKIPRSSAGKHLWWWINASISRVN